MDLFPSLFSHLHPPPPSCCHLLRWFIPIKSHSWASGSCCVCWEWPRTELLRPFQIHHTVDFSECMSCCPHTLRIVGDSGRPICQVTHASIFFFLSGAMRVWRWLCESFCLPEHEIWGLLNLYSKIYLELHHLLVLISLWGLISACLALFLDYFFPTQCPLPPPPITHMKS